MAICIAPVFSGERQNRTEALLLAAKHGRGRMITAKMAASFTFVFLYIAFCCLAGAAVSITLLGTEGWNLPVQLWDTLIPYPMTALGACAANLFIIFQLAAFLTALSLLLSALSRNPMVVLAVDVVFFFGTVFLPFSQSQGLWNKLLYLLPIHSCNLYTVLKTYNSYQFGDVVIPYPHMIFIVYILLTVLCLMGVRKGLRKSCA